MLKILKTFAEGIQQARLRVKVSREHMLAMEEARVAHRQQGAPELPATGIIAEATEAKPTLAFAVAVNRFWQAVLEPIIFYSIVLEGAKDVKVFADVVRGGCSKRMTYIRHLRLHVLLPDYNCTRCWAHESQQEVEMNNRLLAEALWPLLTIFANWEALPETAHKGGPAVRPGLSFELSAGSWSDAEHFRSLYPMHRCFPFETAEDLTRVDTGYAYRLHASLQTTNPSYHGNDTPRSLFMRWGACVRLNGLEPLYTKVTSATPQQRDMLMLNRLDLVRALVVRKRFHRAFDHRLLFSILQLGCQSIHTLRIETHDWHVAVIDGILMDLGRRDCALALRSLHVIGHYSEAQDLITGHEYDEKTLTDVAEGAFEASRDLTHLTAVRYALADHFFSPTHVEVVRTHRQRRRQRADVGAFWPRLEMVSLHEHSDWENSRQGVETLLRAAAVLCEMPKLRLLELCCQYSGKGPYSTGQPVRSCFFRFEAPTLHADGHPYIVFGGHWDTRALWTDECRAAWEAAVACAFPRTNGRPLRVRFHSLRRHMNRRTGFFAGPHHGTALDHPLLLERKIDPVSRDMAVNFLRLMREARLPFQGDPY